MRTLKVLFISTLLAGVGLVSPAPAFSTGPTVISSGKVYCDGENQPAAVKFAVIDDASSGNNTVIAAVTDKKIRVLSYTLVPAADVTIRWESGAGGTALTGQMVLWAEDGVVSQGISANCGPFGCFETAAGALLNLELSGAVSVDGHITYIECS